MTETQFINRFKEIQTAADMGATVILADGSEQAITIELAARYVTEPQQFKRIKYGKEAMDKYGFTYDEVMSPQHHWDIFDSCVQGRSRL